MRSVVVAIGLAMIVGVTVESSAKAATVQTCTVSYIEAFQSGSSVALIMQCVETPGTSYSAYISGAPTNCPTSTADAVKMEESVGMSMRLSGDARYAAIGELNYGPAPGEDGATASMSGW